MAGTCFRACKRKRLAREAGLNQKQLSKNTHTDKEIEQNSHRYTENEKNREQ